MTLASTEVRPDHRGHGDDTLMILSFSGGGSRAAYMAAKVMLLLERHALPAGRGRNLLAEVDAISSVSGGSLPAAYYAITKDSAEESGRFRVWNEDRVLAAMRKNFIWRWVTRWFLPQNALRYWFTRFDRTDIMAGVFAQTLYNRPGFSGSYRFRDLNPTRPFLVLNATNATQGIVAERDFVHHYGTMQPTPDPKVEPLPPMEFGKAFRFTQQQFEAIGSDIGDYSLARAVMASATFPAAFNYMTLRNYSEDPSSYVHVFDGGNHDNLGLSGVLQILLDSRCGASPPKRAGTCLGPDTKVIVVLVDAYTGGGGVSPHRPDGRRLLDFAVDTNFLAATESLLFSNRRQRVTNFFRRLRGFFPLERQKSFLFHHLTFDEIKDASIQQGARAVPTTFHISSENQHAIDQAVEALFNDNHCIAAIEELIVTGKHSERVSRCRLSEDSSNASKD